jgi:hypothetical protein
MFLTVQFQSKEHPEQRQAVDSQPHPCLAGRKTTALNTPGFIFFWAPRMKAVLWMHLQKRDNIS